MPALSAGSIERINSIHSSVTAVDHTLMLVAIGQRLSQDRKKQIIYQLKYALDQAQKWESDDEG